MSRRLWMLAVLFGAAALGLFLADERSAAAPPPVRPALDLAVVAPATVDAGAEFDLRISGPRDLSSAIVDVAVFGALTTWQASEEMTGGRVLIRVPSTVTRHRGSLQIVVSSGGPASTATVEVLPGSAVEPVVPLVGPRTIIADGADRSMVVALPSDAFGNPVADGTQTDIVLRRDDGREGFRSTGVHAGIASIFVVSDTRTGRLTISAGADGADGPSQALDQVAGLPATFELEIDEIQQLADGFTLHTVSTSELRDIHANLLPDGVAVVLFVDAPDGRAIVETTVQGGLARATIEAPNTPGPVVMTARVSGRASTPLTVDFEDAVAGARAALLDDARTIRIVEALAVRGGWLPDGTTVELLDPSGAVVGESALRDGSAELVLPLGVEFDAHRLRVLGAVVQVEESP